MSDSDPDQKSQISGSTSTSVRTLNRPKFTGLNIFKEEIKFQKPELNDADVHEIYRTMRNSEKQKYKKRAQDKNINHQHQLQEEALIKQSKKYHEDVFGSKKDRWGKNCEMNKNYEKNYEKIFEINNNYEDIRYKNPKNSSKNPKTENPPKHRYNMSEITSLGSRFGKLQPGDSVSNCDNSDKKSTICSETTETESISTTNTFINPNGTKKSIFEMNEKQRLNWMRQLKTEMTCGNPDNQYCVDSFGNSLEHRVEVDLNEKHCEEECKQILMEYFDKNEMKHNDFLDLKFSFIDFELFYDLSNDNDSTGNVPYLPAEISIKTFSLRKGFSDEYKSLHSFIDVSDHLEKVKGLIGEINMHTNKYNKIPWDKEEKWGEADWKKLWAKIKSTVFKMSGNTEVLTYFTTDRNRTIGCLKYIAKMAGKIKEYNRLVRPGVTTWDVLCKSILDFMNRLNENKVDEETGMPDPDFTNYVDINSDVQTKKWYQDQLNNSDLKGFDMMRCSFHRNDQIGLEACDCALQTCYKMGFTMWIVVKIRVLQSYSEWKSMNVQDSIPSHFNKKNMYRENHENPKYSGIGHFDNFEKLKKQKIEVAKFKIIEQEGDHYPIDEYYITQAVDMEDVERHYEEVVSEDEVTEQCRVGYTTWKEEKGSRIESSRYDDPGRRREGVDNFDGSGAASSGVTTSRIPGFSSRGRGRGRKLMRR